MDIYLNNTLSKKKEKFIPIDPKEVRMYSCGPTVYNFLHIGNLRSYTFADILKRTLLYNGYKVKHVMNVTDIGHIVADADVGEDKMLNALVREGKPKTLEAMREIADFYFGKAKEDMQKMNILPADMNPFASDHIKADIEMIEDLLKKGIAYKTKNTIFFDTKKFPNYGELGGAVAHDDHSRIGIDSEKRNSADFALWKFADASGIGWDTSFGKGFPGWHIECSAMSLKYLGDTFDIHTGGIDLIPIHHNNEIAQSESYTGKKFVNYWLHNGFITIADGAKMAKTGGNFLTLDVLNEKGINPLAYRYWLLQSRYSTRMDYSVEAILASQTALNKLITLWISFPCHGKVNDDYKNKFIEAVNDDLDTPKALALIWELLKDSTVSDEDKKATIYDFDKVLGLDLENAKTEEIEVSEEIKELLEKRKTAKENKDFDTADKIRKEIEKEGFSVKDGKDGEQTLNKI